MGLELFTHLIRWKLYFINYMSYIFILLIFLLFLKNVNLGLKLTHLTKSVLLLQLGPFKFMWNYRNNPKYWDRYAFANSTDPDQTL